MDVCSYFICVFTVCVVYEITLTGYPVLSYVCQNFYFGTDGCFYSHCYVNGPKAFVLLSSLSRLVQNVLKRACF